MLGLAGLLSIKVTSPVSHMVSSAVRSVLQTILGVVLFGEVVTGRRASSVGVITLGALYYTWIQSGSAPRVNAPSSPTTGEHDEMDEEKLRKPVRPGHGATQSLATLLPLYTPSPSRTRSSPPGSGHSSPTGRRLGSISEEEEYYASAHAGAAGSARLHDHDLDAGAAVDEEEKIALLDMHSNSRMQDGDDRNRVVRALHSHVRLGSDVIRVGGGTNEKV